MHHKFYLLLIIYFGGLLWCTVAAALPSDAQQPLKITADYAKFTHDSGEGLYRGHVTVIQGTSHLQASEATTLSNKQNELLQAIAIGDKQTRAHFWSLFEEGKPELHASAETIKFFPKDHKIFLIGNAEVIQGRDIYRAPHIEYDTLKRHVISKASTAGGTTIIIHPDDHKTTDNKTNQHSQNKQ